MIETQRLYKMAIFPPLDDICEDYRICESDVRDSLNRINAITGAEVWIELTDAIEYFIHELLVGCDANQCSVSDLELDGNWFLNDYSSWISSLIEDELSDEDVHYLYQSDVVEEVDLIATTFSIVIQDLWKHYSKSNALLVANWREVSELIIHDLPEMSIVQLLTHRHRESNV